LDALEDAYDAAFTDVKPTGKQILIGVDISGSMSAPCMGTPISASTAAAAMALTLARIEPRATVVHFDTDVVKIVGITSRTGIASIESTAGGGTDVSSPLRWALGDGTQSSRRYPYGALGRQPLAATPQNYDAFVILTDSESWAGHGHTSQVLEAYRQKINPKAKLVCCSMAANGANVVDSEDPLSFGCAGLDASIPDLVSEFIER
jgi:60 kDa SS-A/Ro ribonucleoprotein